MRETLSRLLGGLICVVMFGPATALALPNAFVQEGLVLDADDRPVDGVHRIRVALYDGANDADPVFEEIHPAVEFFQGYYSISVGSIEDLPPGLFWAPDLWMGITLDGGDELRPRTTLMKVPAAMVSEVARNVIGDITPNTISIGGDLVVDADGQWVGDPTGLRGPAGPAGAAGTAGAGGR